MARFWQCSIDDYLSTYYLFFYLSEITIDTWKNLIERHKLDSITSSTRGRFDIVGQFLGFLYMPQLLILTHYEKSPNHKVISLINNFNKKLQCILQNQVGNGRRQVLQVHSYGQTYWLSIIGYTCLKAVLACLVDKIRV